MEGSCLHRGITSLEMFALEVEDCLIWRFGAFAAQPVFGDLLLGSCPHWMCGSRLSLHLLPVKKSFLFHRIHNAKSTMSE